MKSLFKKWMLGFNGFALQKQVWRQVICRASSAFITAGSNVLMRRTETVRVTVQTEGAEMRPVWLSEGSDTGGDLCAAVSGGLGLLRKIPPEGTPIRLGLAHLPHVCLLQSLKHESLAWLEAIIPPMCAWEWIVCVDKHQQHKKQVRWMDGRSDGQGNHLNSSNDPTQASI